MEINTIKREGTVGVISKKMRLAAGCFIGNSVSSACFSKVLLLA